MVHPANIMVNIENINNLLIILQYNIKSFKESERILLEMFLRAYISVPVHPETSQLGN